MGQAADFFPPIRSLASNHWKQPFHPLEAGFLMIGSDII
jgi:hypothetical protein